MTCFKPLEAWQTKTPHKGKTRISFAPKSSRNWHPIELPCGQCIGCRLDRSKEWAIRCCHETQLHPENTFITLTYDDQNLPYGNTLLHSDFQNFMKRLRKANDHKIIRFYMAGEYGENLGRPHYHAILFNHKFPDEKYHHTNQQGDTIYTSEILSKHWTHGFVTTMDATYQSAAYCARYITSKINGEPAEAHYEYIDADGVIHNRKPEYSSMSVKPGIAKDWFDKYSSDIYPGDFTVYKGRKLATPKYYDRLLSELDPTLHDAIKSQRVKKLKANMADNSPSRLRTREKLQLLKYELLQRNKL